jgi:hypothetical protein
MVTGDKTMSDGSDNGVEHALRFKQQHVFGGQPTPNHNPPSDASPAQNSPSGSTGATHAGDNVSAGPTHTGGTTSPPQDTSVNHDNPHCGGLIDVDGIVKLGGLIGGPGSLIDIEFGQGNGHTAAILDLVVGHDEGLTIDAEILAGLDHVGACGLVDGLFDDCSLLS